MNTTVTDRSYKFAKCPQACVLHAKEEPCAWHACAVCDCVADVLGYSEDDFPNLITHLWADAAFGGLAILCPSCALSNPDLLDRGTHYALAELGLVPEESRS